MITKSLSNYGVNSIWNGWNATLDNRQLETYVTHGYLLNPHVYTVVDMISRAISPIRWNVFEIKAGETASNDFRKYQEFKRLGRPEAKLFQRKALIPVTESSLNTVLKHPNDDQTWTEFVFEVIGWKKLTGNSFIGGISPAGFDNDLFTNLVSIPSPIVRILPKSNGTGIGKFVLNADTPFAKSFEKEEILFLKEWNPSDYIRQKDDPNYMLGMSMFEPLCRVVQRSNESYKASIGMIQNGVPQGILSAKTQQTPGASPNLIQEQMVEQWEEKFRGSENWTRNKVLLSGRELSWTKIALSATDMQLMEADKIDLETIARGAGIPLDMLAQSNSTYTNKSEARKEAWQTLYIPELQYLRDHLNRWLVPAHARKAGKNLFIDYDISDVQVIQPDLRSLSERLLQERDSGLWTANDVRIMLDRDMGDDPHLNEYILTTSRAFVDQNNLFPDETAGFDPTTTQPV